METTTAFSSEGIIDVFLMPFHQNSINKSSEENPEILSSEEKLLAIEKRKLTPKSKRNNQLA
ncbi:MAG: hypothetical protein ABJH44_12370 [Balneola sp.]